MRGAPSARTVVAAFAGVAISFLVATAVSEFSDVEIRSSARAITAKAAPSISHLEAFRSEARRLLVLADDYVDESVAGAAARDNPDSERTAAPVVPTSRESLSASRRRMDEEWGAYRALPDFPGERGPRYVAADAREKFSAELDRALRAVDAGEPAVAVEALSRGAKPAADALNATVVGLVELNARNAKRLAGKIDGLGRHSIRLAVALDGISVLLTFMTALLILRLLRRYTTLVEHRAEELELFAGRVAHDILSPLGAASLALSYVSQTRNASDARAQRILARGQAGIEHTRIIADDLLKFASAGARPDPAAHADVRAVVNAVVDEVRPLADERQVALSIEHADAGAVRCSAGILTSLVSNLVRNAIKYVGEGADRRVVVRARNLGVAMRVEVEDNGPGLPETMETTVFDLYVRGPDNKQPGIGLGLATVKKMAESHGGQVDVRSIRGAGCRFSFELPCAAGGAREVDREGDGDGNADGAGGDDGRADRDLDLSRRPC